MKIGIDLDGVVFDSEMLWATYAELYDIIDLNRNSVINKTEPRIQEKYNWNEQEKKEYLKKYLNTEKFSIVPGAKEVLKLLKKEKNELIVITARGSVKEQSKGIEIAQKKLKEADINFDKYYYSQKNKIEIAKQEKIDIMIDDNYKICENMSKEGIFTIYFHSLNRKHINETENLKEVSNWGEIYRIIKEI